MLECLALRLGGFAQASTNVAQEIKKKPVLGGANNFLVLAAFSI